MVNSVRSFKNIAVSLVAAFLLIAQISAPALSATDKSGSGPKASLVRDAKKGMTFSSTLQKKALQKINMKALRRLDFRLVGSSCAACLGRVRKRIQKVKGVVKVAVAIRKPYGAAVIYDGGKTDKDKLVEAALKNEKVKVKILDVSDSKIDKMPMILWPKFNQLAK